MSEYQPGEIQAAITDIETAVQKRKKAGRIGARVVLVGIGEWILDGDEAAAVEALARLERAIAPIREEWAAIAHDELLLACTEHIRSVDPRFLSLPNYDFAYTVDARQRLEARLLTAERLDLSPPEDLLNRVVQADAILHPFLERRAGRPGPN